MTPTGSPPELQDRDHSAAPPDGDAVVTSTHNLKARTFRAGAYTLASQLVGLAMQLVSMAILGRLLLPSDFGLFAMVVVVTNLASLLKDPGLSTATIQRPHISRLEISNLFWINSGISLLVAVVVAASAPLISWLYDEPRTQGITLVLAASYLINGMAIQHQALLRRQMRFRLLSIIEVVSQGTGLLAAVDVAWLTGSYWALCVMSVTQFGMRTALTWIYSGWMPQLPSRSTSVRPLLTFGGGMLGANTLSYVDETADQMLLGYFAGAAPVGLYAKAYGLLLAPMRRMGLPLSAVAESSLSRLHGEPERYLRGARQSFDTNLCTAFPAILALILMADWVVYIFLGPAWSESAAIYRCLGLACLVRPVLLSCRWLLVTQGRSGKYFRLTAITAMASVVSYVAGVPWGPIGVAIAYSAVSLLVHLPLSIWWSTRSGPVGQGDLYRACWHGLQVGASTVAAVLVVRWAIPADRPAIGLVAGLVMAGAGWLAGMMARPFGRAILSNVRALKRPALVGPE